MEHRDTSGIERMRDLFRTLTHQLLAGCGSPNCKNRYCATGRKNVSHAPVRPYTARSARAIALVLLEESNLRGHVCMSVDAVPRTQNHSVEHEGRRDPSSFMQQLNDTSYLRKAAGHTGSADSPLALEVLHPRICAASVMSILEHSLQPPYLSSGQVNPHFMPHHQVLDCIVPALERLYAPGSNKNQAHWRLLAEVINNGSAFPQPSMQDKGDRSWLSLVDVFEDEPSLLLCATVCKITAQRTRLDDIAAKLAPKKHDDLENKKDVLPFIDRMALQFQQIASSHASQDDGWVPWPYPLWFKKVFVKHWDGSPSVERGTVECGALELLGCLQQIYDKIHDSQKNDAQVLPVVSKRIDTLKMAQSWLQHQPGVTTTSRHLLNCRFLFSASQMVLHWRMINHLTMRQAFATSSANDELFEKFVLNSQTAMIFADQHAASLQHIRDFYLLLSVSRENIVKDAFDQLWQRKKNELVRPLRVRLGEMDGMEIGHDLGGVQIEFFNLICEKLFVADAGMFTTDPITSISYFRPGSLQPLYMFELFGLLVALAIYNGITIPVSFPVALYAQLLHPSEGLEECHETFTLKDLKDGWPDLARSLQAVQDGLVPDTEWVLPIEANGVYFGVGKKAFLRLMREAREYEQGKLDRITMPFSDLTVLDSSLASASAAAKRALPRRHWPGWTLTADPTGTVHPVVPPSSAHHYTNPYIAWLTTYSVFPQLLAFKRGFRVLFPDPVLPLFTPRTLKTTVEGTTLLDLAALRRSTQYDSYLPTDPYIEHFWSVLESWSPEEQKALLKFVTAAGRIPVTGAGALTFRISKAEGGGEEQLPTSSTCFGTLYLPRYEGEGVLEKRLRTAVEFGGAGFGTG